MKPLLFCIQFSFYVQLPTEAAHEFHDEDNNDIPVMSTEMKAASDNNEVQHRLHPDVAKKIRDLVSDGETRQFVIRNLLR